MKKKLKKLELPKLIFTDFDGCLTDDRVWLNQDGEEFVAANRKDGLAINRLKALGIRVVITSTETNRVVTARAIKLGIEALQGLLDKVEAIEALSESAESVAEVISRINSIFADESVGVCLSTIHKAKGLEADRVFIIEPKCLPAPWVKQDWEIEQENNLAYVAYTRAKNELVFVPESEFTTRKK
jgi:YrbI family 3-deoxy-D-manno-octulosonate 8-phosphate phosphatase